jgi:hypothetical protein
LADFLARALPPLMAGRGLIVSDQEIAPPGWRAVALPADVAVGRYFMHENCG